MKNPFLLLVLIIGPSAMLAAQVRAQTFTTLYNFTASPFGTNSDGTTPRGGLTLSGNTLYGAAWAGGSSGNGALFKVNTDGTGFTNLYSFTALLSNTNSDGKHPAGGLVLSGNTLYGTARAGGSSGYGTIFAVNTDGSGFTNLHSFTDAVYQVSALILLSNTLYGTTDLGGTSGNGSIFSINIDGTAFTNIYSFTPLNNSINTDGAYPLAALVASSNILYGTAAGGGSTRYGTVFMLNPDGTGFTNLHTFSSDGYDPNAGLILSGDTLFGATDTGLSLGNGTVFRLNTDGSDFTTLHHFSGGSDGAYPDATLLLLGNTLYGSTSRGGSSNDGVIFKVNTDGTGFTLLHQFSAAGSGTNSDGVTPSGSLVSSQNMLYGTASTGGSSGNGTIFSIFIQPQLTIIPAAENVILTWPTNYSDFVLQSTTNLLAPVVWTTNSMSPVVVNGQNAVTSPISGTQQFFRLRACLKL